ncbi:MAG: DNA translocase FtsK 4TM domain-containing protein [Chloroflexota bacterium]
MARSKSSSKDRNKRPVLPPTWDEQVINQLIPWRVELAGLFLFLFAVLTLLGLINLIAIQWVQIWTGFLRQAFGWGTFPLFLSLAAIGIHWLLNQVERPYQIRPKQVLGFELALLALLPLSYQLSSATLPDAYRGLGGGLFGWALAAPLLDFLGPIMTALIYLSLFAWGVILIIEYRWESFLAALEQLADQLEVWGEQVAPKEKVRRETAVRPTPRPAPLPRPAPPPTDIIEPDPEPDTPSPRRSRKLPPFALLDKLMQAGSNPAEIERKKKIIEQTLTDFGLPATIPMNEIRQGPAVTQFGIVPGYIKRDGPDGQVREQKVRVSQIRSIQRDLALALSAPRLRVQSPVPGRGVVGVEVPNDAVDLVTLRSLVESAPFRRLKSPLAVGLGRDVSGDSVAVDLAKLPHMLIAGTTGSGKSVCINALISCLVFNNPPEKLKLVMIDPKKVELIRFNGLPHMIGNVEVEADRAVGVLRWLTAEMDRRYELFTKTGARNLNGYNRKMGKKKDAQLPYMAVFIDELADLMHTYPGDVERTLCRLAQMARATGIHLVVATQRPSTDVITGLIKANFPARLSFSVASSTDSRVILDTVGADQLLGKGDMLFLPSDAPAPIRVQGAFVSDGEIERIVEFWHKALPDAEPMSPPWETLIAKHALLDETDMLLEAAIELAQKQDYLSTSFLQRRLRLGYPRAARLMETLHEMGLVADPKKGGKTRKSLVDEEDTPLDDLLNE